VWFGFGCVFCFVFFFFWVFSFFFCLCVFFFFILGGGVFFFFVSFPSVHRVHPSSSLQWFSIHDWYRESCPTFFFFPFANSNNHWLAPSLSALLYVFLRETLFTPPPQSMLPPGPTRALMLPLPTCSFIISSLTSPLVRLCTRAGTRDYNFSCLFFSGFVFLRFRCIPFPLPPLFPPISFLIFY